MYECLSTNLTNTHAKVLWRCKKGHEWYASYRSIRRGRGCPKCAFQPRVTAGQYAELAEQRGFIWCGAFPQSTSEKTRWQCAEGHVWEARFSNMLHNQAGCPACKAIAQSKRRFYHASKYHELATLRGFEWVGGAVVNTFTDTEWRCGSGHKWFAAYNTVQQGHGCPHCLDMVNGVRVSKPQRAIHALLGGELNYPAGRYRIDVAIEVEGVPIAVEYDGWHWHQYSDEAPRDSALLAMGWRILHVRSDVLTPTLEQLHSTIQQLIDGAVNVEIVLSDWKN